MQVIDKYHVLFAERSNFCLGIDPSISIFEQWSLDYTLDGLKQFCDIVVRALEIIPLALVKLQSAYFESFGPDGMRQAQHLSLQLQKLGIKVMLDAKRGDIGSTMEAYAHAYISKDGYYNFDAMTLLPYMGFGALKPALDIAIRDDKLVFIVVSSSNIEGRDLQTSIIHNNTSLEEFLAGSITNYSMQTDSSNIGAVVGATIDNPHKVISKLPRSLILTPGIGVQGGDINHVLNNFGCRKSVIPISARSVFKKGPTIVGLSDEIKRHVEACRV